MGISDIAASAAMALATVLNPAALGAPNPIAVLSTATLPAAFTAQLNTMPLTATRLPECPPLALSTGLQSQSGGQQANDQYSPEASELSQLVEDPTQVPWLPVQWQLTPGLLRPQLETLLRDHWHIQNFVWHAASGHYWPTHYTLSASSWDELLNALLTPYQLRVALHANHTAVIDYLPQQRGQF